MTRYTIRALPTTLDALLCHPMTINLLDLLEDKTVAGLGAIARQNNRLARGHHAEAFGAYEFWLMMNRDQVLSLDDQSKARLDNHLFRDLRHLDEAVAVLEDA